VCTLHTSTVQPNVAQQHAFVKWIRFQTLLMTSITLPETQYAVRVTRRSAIYADGIRHVRATNRFWNRDRFSVTHAVHMEVECSS
jgi:hypothetical protein